MKDLENRLERLIRLATPDTMELQLEDGQVAELAMEDIWDALVEILYAFREDRDYYKTEPLVAIERAEPGQHPMIELIQALIVSFKLHEQKQIEGERLEGEH